MNSWSNIKLNLPQPMAKMGCVSMAEAEGYEKTDILILGGIDSEYFAMKRAIIINLEFSTINDIGEMKQRRIFQPGSGVFLI